MFDRSHLSIVFAEQPILYAWKCPGCQRYLKRGSTNMVYGSNVCYPSAGYNHSNKHFFKYVWSISGYHSLKVKYITYYFYQVASHTQTKLQPHSSKRDISVDVIKEEMRNVLRPVKCYTQSMKSTTFSLRLSACDRLEDNIN